MHTDASFVTSQMFICSKCQPAPVKSESELMNVTFARKINDSKVKEDTKVRYLCTSHFYYHKSILLAFLVI
jgi:hypothetical protein